MVKLKKRNGSKMATTQKAHHISPGTRSSIYMHTYLLDTLYHCYIYIKLLVLVIKFS